MPVLNERSIDVTLQWYVNSMIHDLNHDYHRQELPNQRHHSLRHYYKLSIRRTIEWPHSTVDIRGQSLTGTYIDVVPNFHLLRCCLYIGVTIHGSNVRSFNNTNGIHTTITAHIAPSSWDRPWAFAGWYGYKASTSKKTKTHPRQ